MELRDYEFSFNGETWKVAPEDWARYRKYLVERSDHYNFLVTIIDPDDQESTGMCSWIAEKQGM